MKRVFSPRLALIAAALLMASVAGAASNWTRPAASGVGDWSTFANWDTPPAASTDYTYLGTAANAEIQVTGAETYGYRMVLGHTSSVPPVLRIKNGGSLSQGTYSTGSHSYVGKTSGADGHMIIEAGGTFSTNAKLYISAYAGSVGTVDVAGVLDMSNGYGELNFGDTYPSTATGYLNVLDGGVVKVTTFDTGLSGIQQPMSATSMIDIQGTGKIVDSGYTLAQANTLIASGQVSGNGIVGNVEAVYDTVLNETSIVAVIPDALSVDVGIDKHYKRGAVPLTLAATVVDDGVPATAVLTWSQTAGSGTATFASPNSAATDVTFDAAGLYTLRLTADNTGGGGSEVIYDELDVTVSNPDCQDVVDANLLLAADVNGDCYVNLADVAEVAAAWLNCSNPQDVGCDWSYPVTTLVQDGQPMAVIVIGTGASTTEQYAADELQLYLEKISGATVPIVTEGGTMPARAIVIGTPDTCQYIDNSGLVAGLSLGRDGLRIKTVDDVVVLAGENPAGALYATYAFLEEYLGCRWFFPSVDGEYVPSMTTIEIDRIDDTQIAAMEYRGIHKVGSGYDDPEVANWMARNRMNYISQVVFESYHRPGVEEHIKKGLIFNTETHFSHWLGGGELFDAHPEYFPLLDGVRVEGFPSGYNPDVLQQHNYCLSNLDLVQEVADAIEDYVLLYPEVEIIAVNQQDSVSWCECGPCTDLGSPTDRLHTFLNRLVAELDQRGSILDNRMLSTQAYLGTDELPVTVTPNPKLIIQYALISHCARHGWNESCPTQEFQKDRLNGWLGYGNKVIAYTYHAELCPGYSFPIAYHSLDAMKYYNEIGMSGWYPETHADTPGQYPLARDPNQITGDQWYAQKEMYYTAAKALWNPRVTLEEIKDDFFPKFYGAAGPAMRNYYETLEQAWHYPGDVLYLHKRILGYDPGAVIDFLDQDLIDTLNGYLADAVALYAGEPQAVKDRVDRDVDQFDKWEQKYIETGGVAGL